MRQTLETDFSKATYHRTVFDVAVPKQLTFHAGFDFLNAKKKLRLWSKSSVYLHSYLSTKSQRHNQNLLQLCQYLYWRLLLIHFFFFHFYFSNHQLCFLIKYKLKKKVEYHLRQWLIMCVCVCVLCQCLEDLPLFILVQRAHKELCPWKPASLKERTWSVRSETPEQRVRYSGLRM